MKQIIFIFVFALMANTLFAQIYREGIVKGSGVVYDVTKKSQSWNKYKYYTIKNLNNPDTSFRHDISNSFICSEATFQVLDIIYDNLSHDELLELKEQECDLHVFLRIDVDTRRVLQVSKFVISTTDTIRDFWLNFPPDRLYRLERDIIEKVRIYNFEDERFRTNDMALRLITQGNLLDIEGRKKAKKEIFEWKALWDKVSKEQRKKMLRDERKNSE